MLPAVALSDTKVRIHGRFVFYSHYSARKERKKKGNREECKEKERRERGRKKEMEGRKKKKGRMRDPLSVPLLIHSFIIYLPL